MKRFLCIFMALSVMVSTMIFTTNTATAATVDVNSVATDVDIWNHEFKNDISGEVIWAIDELEDDDTIAIKVDLLRCQFEYDDYVEFAEKNNRTDELIINTETGIIDATDEFLADYFNYVYAERSKGYEGIIEIINNDYSVAPIHYMPTIATYICVATKAQVISLADAEIDVDIDLADKKYFDPRLEITWDEFKQIGYDSIEFIEENYNDTCSEGEYDVHMYSLLNDIQTIWVMKNTFYNNEEPIIQRTGDIMWESRGGDGTYILFYDDGEVKNLPQMYYDGKLTDYELDQLGGEYYGDINSNRVVDVNDVTNLQIILLTDYAGKPIEYPLEMAKYYRDLNFDNYVDVKDVTTLQMYLAGYDV